MAIDERSRHDLHHRLEEVLGPEAADILMAHLPIGWSDVATKHDLHALDERIEFRTASFEERVDLRFAAADERLAATRFELLATFRGELAHQTRTMVYANLGAVFTAVAFAFAASRVG